MNVIGVIPARYRSTRFPGKPLADILGKPMIYHVYQACSKSRLITKVVVATDDERIAEACKKFEIPWIMTADRHPTGTDRVAEVAQKVDGDLYVNIQGDEPMIRTKTIDAAVVPLLEGGDIQVTNLCAEILDPDELVDTNVVKVVRDPDSFGIYLSRQPIPYPKDRNEVSYFKQVCVYGFFLHHLKHFLKFEEKTYYESIEDIEILRFHETGIPVRMLVLQGSPLHVDTMEDLNRAQFIAKEHNA